MPERHRPHETPGEGHPPFCDIPALRRFGMDPRVKPEDDDAEEAGPEEARGGGIASILVILGQAQRDPRIHA